MDRLEQRDSSGLTKSLPMELQMVLCYRVVGSHWENIPGEQRELAFKELAGKLIQ